jgi:hypothetical protein
VAVVKNITDEALSLLDGRSVEAGAEADIPNEQFADRAWPTSTWALVKKPGKGFHDHSVDDAIVFLPADADEVSPADEENV